MKLRINFHFRLSILILIITLGLASGCGAPGAQVTKTGWQVQRYGLFNNVWASLATPLQLDALNDNIWRSVVLNGYVKTDNAGQAQMRRGSTCSVYIFQTSSFGATEESIYTCPKGSTSSNCTKASTALISNCGISSVTLPGNVTYHSTVLIIEYRDLESTVIMTSEGTASVTPNDPAQPPFDINANEAAYMVSPELRQQAEGFFGFPPDTIVGFDRMVGPIENMGQVRQIQSANLILASRGFPAVPLPVQYTLGMRWIGQPPDVRVSQAIAQAVDWNPTLNRGFPGIPLLFEAQIPFQDVRSSPFDPQTASALLAEAGYPRGQELTIAFDETIPNLGDVATSIQKQLNQLEQFSITRVGFNADTAQEIFSSLETKGVPSLVLSGE